MKSLKVTFQSAVVLIITGFLLSSCLKDSCSERRTFIQYNPIYTTLADIRINIQSEPPRELVNPGKLYFYNNYILVNEIREGIHIIDNTDPKNPNNLAFIPIPGNVDMAVRNNTMFVDNYMDILSIDISDPFNPILKHRVEDVYQQYNFIEGRGILVGYNETPITTELNCTDPNFNNGGFFLAEDVLWAGNEFDAAQGAGGVPVNTNAPTVSGIGGSLARFTIYDEYLYVLDETNLFTLKIEQDCTLDLLSELYVNWGMETIFPFRDKLFLGSQEGMFIYDISNPSEPFYISVFSHGRACDPVFVDGDIAYVTLRDGTQCQTFSNQLDVINISDLFNPQLIISHSMENPHGLSKINSDLYICEGIHGLKVFDASDDMKIGDRLLDHIKDVHAYDVIAIAEDHLLMIGKDGLYQYDVSDADDIKEISKISVNR